MAKLKKIGEIGCYGKDDIKDVIETLEKQGFTVIDNDERETGWKTYHILKES